MFDSEMSMKAHVSSINRSAYPQVKNVRAIKPFLDNQTSNTSARVFYMVLHNAYIQRTQHSSASIVTYAI